MSNVERIDRLPTQPKSLTTSPGRGEQSGTLAANETAALPSETGKATPSKTSPATEPPEHAAEKPSESEEASRSTRRPLVRWALFALLPLALIAGGYWYVTGGQVMSTDNAYVEADKVGVSTDVSGHRQGDRRHGEPARRSRPDPVPSRSPPVPDRPGQRQGQPRADGADHRRDEAGLPAHAERRRRATGAGRARSGDLSTATRRSCVPSADLQGQLRPGALHARARQEQARIPAPAGRRCNSPGSPATRTFRSRSTRSICRPRHRSTRRSASSITPSSRRRSPAS